MKKLIVWTPAIVVSFMVVSSSSAQTPPPIPPRVVISGAVRNLFNGAVYAWASLERLNRGRGEFEWASFSQAYDRYAFTSMYDPGSQNLVDVKDGRYRVRFFADGYFSASFEFDVNGLGSYDLGTVRLEITNAIIENLKCDVRYGGVMACSWMVTNQVPVVLEAELFGNIPNNYAGRAPLGSEFFKSGRTPIDRAYQLSAEATGSWQCVRLTLRDAQDSSIVRYETGTCALYERR